MNLMIRASNLTWWIQNQNDKSSLKPQTSLKILPKNKRKVTKPKKKKLTKERAIGSRYINKY